MEHNLSRNQLIKDLSSYYHEVGVNPSDFHCKFRDQCSGKLARGMECHVGRKYGVKKRVLVSSMDSGGGGSNDINGRTDSVYIKHDNPHMRGTLACVKQLLDLDNLDESVEYMAMTNACKCCKIDSTNHLSKMYYENCKEYKIAEYHMLKPDVILFQGKRDLSLRGVEIYLKPTNLDYLYLYDDGIINCYGIECIHPSARGKNYHKRKNFYEETFPQIAEYIKV